TPIGRQSFTAAAPAASDSTSVSIPQPAAPPMDAPIAAADITGTIPQAGPGIAASPGAGRKLTTIQIPPTEQLPEAIGGPLLRSAALKGDPAAAYEIGVRYA